MSLNLDHNATTPVCPEVREAMEPYFTDISGNPSSRCYVSKSIRDAVETARQQVASLIHGQPDEIVFTSGGTESNALAMFQFVKGCGEILTSATEHSSVLRNGDAWCGRRLTRLPVRADGQLELGVLGEALLRRASGISLHLSNNETGVIWPIRDWARQWGVPFHTDAVQALGKMVVDVQELGVDFASFSAHKIYGPKGVGALWVKAGGDFMPLIHGGGQEGGRRSGTENVAGIVGFGKACELVAAGLRERVQRTREVRDSFERAVAAGWPAVIFHVRDGARLSNTSSLRIPGVPSAEFLLMLDERGLCAAAGAACQGRQNAPSHVMLAMGLTESEARGSLRFSFGRDHTRSDAEKAAEIVVKMARRYFE